MIYRTDLLLGTIMAVMFFFSVGWNFNSDDFMRMIHMRGSFKFKYAVSKSTFNWTLRILNTERLNQCLVDMLDDEFYRESDHAGGVTYQGYVKITKAMIDNYKYNQKFRLRDDDRILVRKICAEEEEKEYLINLMVT